MSLINNMLRDLESRNKQGGNDTLSADAPMVEIGPENNRRKLFFCCLFVLVIAAAGLSLKAVPTFISEEPEVQLAAAQQERIADDRDESFSFVNASDQTEILRPLIPVVAEEPSVEAKHDPVVVENDDAILLSALSVEEDVDRAQIRLDFARMPDYRLLQNGSSTEPLIVSFSATRLGAGFDMPDMQAGMIKNISLRPQKDTLQLLIDMKDQMLVRGLQVIEGEDHAYQLLIDLKAEKDHIEPIVSTVVNSREQAQTQVETAPEPEPLPISIVPVVAEGVSKKVEPLALDQQAFLLGMEELQRRNLNAAQAAFEQTLQINPQMADARMQLVDLLFLRGQVKQAEAQLRQGQDVSSDNIPLRKQFVRFLLQQQRSLEAIGLLQSKPKPAIAEDLEYHALLAAALQESAQFKKAGELYRQLVTLRPQQPVWWMGLAISMDQSGISRQARIAYERAAALPGLSPDLHNYIQSRLQAL